MKRHSVLVIGLTVALITPAALRAESDYAAKCEQEIGMPVPPVDCSDPNGSEVPVGKVSGGQCETPSHGLSGCYPGTRFLRFDDTFKRTPNGPTEKVTTLIMCRKTRADQADPGGNTYSDIGVIQYNETKHATCWFSKTVTTPIRPTKALPAGRLSYPSPSDADGVAYWGSQPASDCVSCHSSGVWLRTPFAMGVEPQNGKGYQRQGFGDYLPGTGNNIPNDHQDTNKRGLSCSVGKPTWNRQGRSGIANLLKIDSSACYKRFPEERPAPGVESAGRCTACHYVGAGNSGSPSCNAMVGELTNRPHPGRLADAGFARHFWMPLDPGVDTPEEYATKYKVALGALTFCCNTNNEGLPGYKEICQSKFEGGKDSAALRAISDRGACALCPTCEGDSRRGTKGPARVTH